MKIIYKSRSIKMPKKILGVRTVFPITFLGNISIDNSLLLDKDFKLEEVILNFKERVKKFKGFQ